MYRTVFGTWWYTLVLKSMLIIIDSALFGLKIWVRHDRAKIMATVMLFVLNVLSLLLTLSYRCKKINVVALIKFLIWNLNIKIFPNCPIWMQLVFWLLLTSKGAMRQCHCFSDTHTTIPLDRICSILIWGKVGSGVHCLSQMSFYSSVELTLVCSCTLQLDQTSKPLFLHI